MLYSELEFRGTYMQRERQRVERERLTAASFSAWQILQAHTEKLPAWGKYLAGLGLADKPQPTATKEDLKREADQAMEKANRILNTGRL